MLIGYFLTPKLERSRLAVQYCGGTTASREFFSPPYCINTLAEYQIHLKCRIHVTCTSVLFTLLRSDTGLIRSSLATDTAANPDPDLNGLNAGLYTILAERSLPKKKTHAVRSSTHWEAVDTGAHLWPLRYVRGPGSLRTM